MSLYSQRLSLSGYVTNISKAVKYHSGMLPKENLSVRSADFVRHFAISIKILNKSAKVTYTLITKQSRVHNRRTDRRPQWEETLDSVYLGLEN